MASNGIDWPTSQCRLKQLPKFQALVKMVLIGHFSLNAHVHISTASEDYISFNTSYGREYTNQDDLRQISICDCW